VNQPSQGRVDPPTCREDLVREAAQAGAGFRSAFDWLNDKQANLAASHPGNRGLTAIEIRQLAEDWILEGKPIVCTPETRDRYKERRHFYYHVIVPVDDIPRGLFVEMELANCDENDPTVNLLNAHPSSF